MECLQYVIFDGDNACLARVNHNFTQVKDIECRVLLPDAHELPSQDFFTGQGHWKCEVSRGSWEGGAHTSGVLGTLRFRLTYHYCQVAVAVSACIKVTD